MSLHRYLYANADPVNHVDPDGRETLMNLTFTQAISGTLDAATTSEVATKACAAKTSLEQVQSLAATSQQVVALTGLFATGVMVFGAVSGGKGGSVDLAYVSPDFAKESIVKNFQFQLKGGGGKVGVGFSASNHANQSLKASATLLPPPMNVSFGGAAKAAFERKFYYCGLVELGKIALESEFSFGGGADVAKGLYVGGAWSNSIEGSLFRGTLNVSWPIFSVGSKNYDVTFGLLGVFERTISLR